jgi:hypothetical protein
MKYRYFREGDKGTIWRFPVELEDNTPDEGLWETEAGPDGYWNMGKREDGILLKGYTEPEDEKLPLYSYGYLKETKEDFKELSNKEVFAFFL